MGQSFLRSCVAAIVLFLAGGVGATTYEITDTTDAVANDGVCTLREALEAINTTAEVNECEAGTSSNVIRLLEAGAFDLTEGMLEIGSSSGAQSVIFDVVRDSPFDESERDNPIITQTSSTDRIFYVTSGSILSLNNVTLIGGDVSGAQAGLASDPDDDGLGGQIYSAGTVLLDDGTVLDGGNADQGGAIYLSGGQLSVTNATIQNHSATGDGGAVASRAATTVLLFLERAYFGGNTAAGDGGGFFLDGSRVSLEAVNVTFYDNTAVNGAAIRFESGVNRTSDMNNVTVAGNTASGDGALSYSDLTTGSDKLINSVVVGNVGGDCGQDDPPPPVPPDPPLPPATAIADATIQYTVSDGSCVNASFIPFVDGPPYTDGPHAGADFRVLQGTVVCGAAPGPASCSPIELSNGLLGFLPNPDALADTGRAALDQGSPVSATQESCDTFDQREAAREDTCDAGALELRIAQGVLDEFNLISGQTESIDVLENDIGEVGVDCGLVLPLATFPLSAPAGDPAVEPCLSILVEPIRGTLVVDIDVDGYPTLSYTSQQGFHGIDSFRYEVPDAAFEGKTLGDRGAAAAAFLVVEPRSGLTESADITDESGSLSPFALFVLLAATHRRRIRRLWPVLVLLFCGPLQAAEIFVDAPLDDDVTVRGDGVCTLREALGNVIDNNPLFSPDCAPGATGSDTIILPAGTLTLNSQLDVVGSNVVIEGAATADASGAPVQESTIIEGSGTHRLIQASSGLTLRNLTLQGGRATGDGGAIFTEKALALEQVALLDNQATGDGGAIYLNANPNDVTDVTFAKSYAADNVAAGEGGLLSTFGQNQVYRIYVENSTFFRNQGGTGPGAFDLSLASGSMIVVNSTFSANRGASGTGSAIDVLDSSARFLVLNSTFLDFDGSNGASGAINAGPNDGTTNSLRIFHSIYSGAGTCSSDALAVPAESAFNLFDSGTGDTTCGQGGVDNSEAAQADIGTVLNGGVLLFPDPPFVDGVYTPPHFPIDPAQSGNPAYDLIVDAGNPAAPAEGSNIPIRCRSTDFRGLSRLSGADPLVPEGCDLGAFELQVATAVADTASNRNRRGRFAIIDVLANDVPGEDETILTDSITVTPSYAFAKPVLRDDVEADCVAGADCVMRFDAPGTLVCPDDFEDDPPEFTFTYTFDATLDPPPGLGAVSSVSSPGEVTVTILNVPIYFDSQTRIVERGESAVFPLVAEDVDGVIDWDSIELSAEPAFAAVDDNGTPAILDDDEILGTGVIIDTDARRVTYVPRDLTKTFSDSFTLMLTDDCGTESQANFFINYEDDSASGGQLGSGSMGWSGLGLLLLGLKRRRRA